MSVAGFGGINCQFDYGIRAVMAVPSPLPSAVDCSAASGMSPCHNGGTCRPISVTIDDEEDEKNTWTCDCTVGFTGHDCSAKVRGTHSIIAKAYC